MIEKAGTNFFFPPIIVLSVFRPLPEDFKRTESFSSFFPPGSGTGGHEKRSDMPPPHLSCPVRYYDDVFFFASLLQQDASKGAGDSRGSHFSLLRVDPEVLAGTELMVFFSFFLVDGSSR